jgi:hypothetical protein
MTYRVFSAEKITVRALPDHQFGVLLAVQNQASSQTALTDAGRARKASDPHLSGERRRHLDAHPLGYVDCRRW